MKKGVYPTILAFVVLSLLGVAAAFNIPLSLEPSQVDDRLTISYTWPGASPQAIERQVASSVEGVAATLQGIKKITSVSNYHKGSVTISLQKGSNPDQARFEVAAKLRRLYQSLPAGVSYPVILAGGPATDKRYEPFMMIQLNGNAPASELYLYADKVLKPRLSRLSGVTGIDVYGGNKAGLQIKYRKGLMEGLGVLPSDIVSALRNTRSETQVGWVYTPGMGLLSVSTAPLSAGEKLANTIIKSVDDRIIRLGDIATLSNEELRAENIYRINGLNAIMLTLRPGEKVNQLALAAETRELLHALEEWLPAGYGIHIDYDASVSIRENLERNWWQVGASIGLLLLFMMLIIRNTRLVGIVIACLSATFLLTLLILYVFRIEVHLYVLAAMTVSLGFLVDNTLIMIDHYSRYRQKDIVSALLGTAFTTAATLSVLLFLPEEAKSGLMSFAVALIVVLVISMAVTYWLLPSLTEWLYTTNAGRTAKRTPRWMVWLDRFYGSVLDRLLRYRKTVFLAALLAFGLPVFLLPSRLADTHRLAAFYNPVLGSDWYLENVRPWTERILGGSLRLFANYVYESSVTNNDEQTVLYAVAELPNHSTLEQMDDIFMKLETVVTRYPEVERFVTRIQSGQNGRMTVHFTKAAEEEGFPYLLKARLIAATGEMSGINWDIYGVGRGFSQRSGENPPTFRLSMRGYDYHDLEAEALRLKKLLERHPRVEKVDIDRDAGYFSYQNAAELFTYALDPDEREMARQGVSRQSLQTWSEEFNSSPQPALYLPSDDGYLPVTLVPDQPSDLWGFAYWAAPLPDNSFARTKDLFRIAKVRVLPKIVKEDQQYIRNIGFKYLGSSAFGERFLNTTLDEFKPDLPLGYSVKKEVYDWWKENARRQYELIGVVMLLIFIVGAVLFESFRQPFAMLAIIPLSFVGVFLLFYLTGFNFDQGGYTSLILLSGLSVNVVIFAGNEFNRLRKNTALGDLRAYRQAVRRKIRPVLFSLLATCLNLAPFLAGEGTQAFWPALALGTIAGLFASLFFFLLIVPLFLIGKR